MGAPKVTDTSKSQAKVEKAKLEAQKEADEFESQLSEKQYALSKQGLEATEKIGELRTDMSKLSLEEAKNTSGFLSRTQGSLSKLDDETLNRLGSQSANLDKFLSTKPVRASFVDVASIFGGNS